MGVYDASSQITPAVSPRENTQSLRHRSRRRPRHRPSPASPWRACNSMARCTNAIAGHAAGLRTDPDARALDSADAVYNSICRDIERLHRASHGVEAPTQAQGTRRCGSPRASPRRSSILLSTASPSIIWAIGYRADYSWIKVGVFDGSGRPTHRRGETHSAQGLYFVGLPWMHTWGSGRFLGVAADAEHVWRAGRDHRRSPPTRQCRCRCCCRCRCRCHPPVPLPVRGQRDPSMTAIRVAAVAAHFGRDVERGDAQDQRHHRRNARSQGVGLLVLPYGTLGGYIGDLYARPTPTLCRQLSPSTKTRP